MTQKTIDQMVRELEAKYNQGSTRILSTIPSEKRTAVAYNVVHAGKWKGIERTGVYNGQTDVPRMPGFYETGWEFARHLYSLKEEDKNCYKLEMSSAAGGSVSARFVLSESPRVEGLEIKYGPDNIL